MNPQFPKAKHLNKQENKLERSWRGNEALGGLSPLLFNILTGWVLKLCALEQFSLFFELCKYSCDLDAGEVCPSSQHTSRLLYLKSSTPQTAGMPGSTEVDWDKKCPRAAAELCSSCCSVCLRAPAQPLADQSLLLSPDLHQADLSSLSYNRDLFRSEVHMIIWPYSWQVPLGSSHLRLCSRLSLWFSHLPVTCPRHKMVLRNQSLLWPVVFWGTLIPLEMNQCCLEESRPAQCIPSHPAWQEHGIPNCSIRSIPAALN